MSSIVVYFEINLKNIEKDRVNLPPLKCPRCHSINTKFCYYNNRKYSQPRHKCKSCNRQWTLGGALRDIPEGGRRRKNKRSNSQSATVSNPPVSEGGLLMGNTRGLNFGGSYPSMAMSTVDIMNVMMTGSANSSAMVKMEGDNMQAGLNLENELLMEVFGSDANATSTMDTNNIINNQFSGSINDNNNNLFSFSCVPRSANSVAHELTQFNPIFFAERIWEKDQGQDSINDLAAIDRFFKVS